MLNQTRQGLFVIALSACCAMVSCDDGGNPKQDPGTCETGCFKGFTCDQDLNECVKLATINEPCGPDAENAKCNPSYHITLACIRGVCQEKIVNAGCESDDDCSSEQYCNKELSEPKCTDRVTTQEQCGSCTTDSDCKKGLKCQANVCMKVAGWKQSCNVTEVCQADSKPCDTELACDLSENICKKVLKLGDNCGDATGTMCGQNLECFGEGKKTCVSSATS